MAGNGGCKTGKLKWAGEAWATGRLTTAPTEIDEDARLWGLDPTQFQGPDDGGLWEVHIPALNAFLTVSSQWRILVRQDGTYAHLGLDYTAARMGFRLAGLKVPPDLWADVQMIEAGAIAALNRKM